MRLGPLLFFIFVEVPAVGARLTHRAITLARGHGSAQLDPNLYRLIGVSTEIAVLALGLFIGLDAACTILALIIVGGVGLQLVKRHNAAATTEAATATPPEALPGVLAGLSRRSLEDLALSSGRPGTPPEQEIHHRSADLMAALRYYQIAIDATVTDESIGAQLGADPAGVLTRFEESYRRLDASRERDVAVQILHVHRPQAGADRTLYTTFAGNALRDAGRRRTQG